MCIYVSRDNAILFDCGHLNDLIFYVVVDDDNNNNFMMLMIY